MYAPQPNSKCSFLLGATTPKTRNIWKDIANRGCSLAVRVKRPRKAGTGPIKFKLRASRYLYTLGVRDADKADKLKQSLPPCEFN